MLKSAEDLADNNIIEAIREHARWQSPSELVEDHGAIMMAGQTDFPGAFKNCVARINRHTPANEVISLAKAFFGKRSRGFTVFSQGCRDEDLEGQLHADGFVHRVDAPCMLVSQPVSMPVLAEGIRLEPFAEQQHVHDAAAINAEAYKALGLEAQETLAYFSQYSRVISDNVMGCVAYKNGKPLATALGIKSEGAVGVYWVGTVPAAERMGLASACTAYVTNKAFAQGASVVTLQASAFGAPVYHRLGYATYNHLKFFRYVSNTK